MVVFQPENNTGHVLITDGRNKLGFCEVVDQCLALAESVDGLLRKCFILLTPTVVRRSAHSCLLTGNLHDRCLAQLIDDCLLFALLSGTDRLRRCFL